MQEGSGRGQSPGGRRVHTREMRRQMRIHSRLGDDGMHHEAFMSRPLLQSCVARLSRHARRGIIAIHTATNEKAREIYRAISVFLSRISSASQLSREERRHRTNANSPAKWPSPAAKMKWRRLVGWPAPWVADAAALPLDVVALPLDVVAPLILRLASRLYPQTERSS